MGITVEKVQELAPGLVDSYRKAGFNASKHGIDEEQVAVYLVLDRSASMRQHYLDGTVQYFGERILAMAAHLEDDGKVPVCFFSNGIDGVGELDLEDYEGKVQKWHSKMGRMGGTNYVDAMDWVINHYLATGKTVPALVIFQTDGSPRNRRAAAQKLCEAAKLPLFWQYVGFGEDREYDEDDEYGLGFLQRLDNIPAPRYRVVDNSDFFPTGLDPRQMRDGELYSRLLSEFPNWLTAARALGIVQ